MEKFEYLNDLQLAAEKLIHSYGFLAMITLLLKWVASVAAILLLILDGTKWKSANMWTSLIAPYLFFSLPLVVFQFLRREFGNWIALLTVVLRLFLPNHFPELAESLETPGATVFLIATAPTFLVETFRGEADDLRDPSNVCLLTSGYLLSKHTKACGGYKNSFIQKDKVTYTICLYLPSLVWIYLRLLDLLRSQLFTMTKTRPVVSFRSTVNESVKTFIQQCVKSTRTGNQISGTVST